MSNKPHTYWFSLDVPAVVKRDAWIHRDLRPSDARALYVQALEAIRANMVYKREWPRCSTHWNEGLGKWVAVHRAGETYHCFAVLLCDQCGPIKSPEIEYFQLSELDEFANGKV